MRHLLLAVCLLSSKLLVAQDYLIGRMIDMTGSLHKVHYDRTQDIVRSGVYQSVYKIMDESGGLKCSVTIDHDRTNSAFNLAIRSSGITKQITINYQKSLSGLIYSDLDDMDTSFGGERSYLYLLSFTDTSREYPVLHSIKTDDGKEFELDPLTKLRIKKHNELVRAIRIKPKNTGEVHKETFSGGLVHLRDSMYNKNMRYIDYIGQLKKELDAAVATVVKGEPLFDGEKRYVGEKKNGHVEGKGLLIESSCIYKGDFVHGKFNTGKAIMRTGNSEYIGGISGDSLNDTGWLKYKDGGFLLGIFRNGTLYDGICLSKGKNGEVYFGDFKNNKRTGYGELRNGAGDMYYGEFLNGRLIRGYSKEVDQFGYSTYSKIENGTKVSIDPQQAKDFFDITALSRK